VVVDAGLYGLVRWLRMLVVVGGGRNVALTVFRRCAAPENIRIVRTAGSNSGEIWSGWLVEVGFLVFLGLFSYRILWID